MNANLTPNEVVAWLRKQAKIYNDAADSIASTLSPPIPTPEVVRYKRSENAFGDPPPSDHQPIPFTLDNVRSLLSKKAKRVGDIAMDFAVSEHDVSVMLTNEAHGFESKERGWWKYTQK